MQGHGIILLLHNQGTSKMPLKGTADALVGMRLQCNSTLSSWAGSTAHDGLTVAQCNCACM